MLHTLKEMTNFTTTENGARTYASSLSDCLDLFATIGALRHANDAEIIGRFKRAYAENADLAVKMLFYARDIRGGLGERRVPKTILRWLAQNHTESVIKNIPFIIAYGRYDDLLILLDTPCGNMVMEVIQKQLHQDMENMKCGQVVSLLAKWLPSVNTSNVKTVKQGREIARRLHMTEKEYRKTLSALRAHIDIIENRLREKDYTFEYEKQPSKALFKYKSAFYRNDGERYRTFLERVSSGEAVMHTGSLAPYEIIEPIVADWDNSLVITKEKRQSLDVTWKALEDFTGGENALVVVDGSGSMYGGSKPMPAAIALSLGIYYAERNTGAFKNHFITFSKKPRLVEIKGSDIVEKVRYCETFNEVADTNIQRVFELILNTAVQKQLPQEELPAYLYIISDMEFNYCIHDASITNFEYAKKLFAEHGYTLPQVVFWNVDSRVLQVPVTMNEQGVILVSGSSSRVFQMVAQKELSPYKFMLDILNGERYKDIVA